MWFPPQTAYLLNMDTDRLIGPADVLLNARRPSNAIRVDRLNILKFWFCGYSNMIKRGLYYKLSLIHGVSCTIIIHYSYPDHPLSRLIRRQKNTSLRVSFLNAGLAIPKELLPTYFI